MKRKLKTLNLTLSFLSFFGGSFKGSYKGLGELLIMLLVAGVAGLALLFYAHLSREDLRHSQAFATGKNLSAWLYYTHLYVNDNQGTFAGVPGMVITQNTLTSIRLAPDWLSTTTHPDDTITLGVIDDGNGVPMAFVVWNTTIPLPLDFRDTILDGLSLTQGIAKNTHAGIAGITNIIGTSLTHQPSIEAAIGYPLEVGDIVLTADIAIEYNFTAFYRKSQPGHPELNQMQDNLDLGGNNFSAFDLRATSGEITTDVTVNGQANITDDMNISGNATSPLANLQRLDANTLQASQTTVTELLVGTLTSNVLSAEDIEAQTAIFTTSLDVENTAATAEAQFIDAQINNSTTVQELQADVIYKPSGDLISKSDGVNTDQLYSPLVTIENTLTTGECAGC